MGGGGGAGTDRLKREDDDRLDRFGPCLLATGGGGGGSCRDEEEVVMSLALLEDVMELLVDGGVEFRAGRGGGMGPANRKEYIMIVSNKNIIVKQTHMKSLCLSHYLMTLWSCQSIVL